MKRIMMVVLAILTIALAQSAFPDLPAIAEVNSPPVVITKIKAGDAVNLSFALTQAEKWAKFVFPGSTGKCQSLDMYTMTGGFFQIESDYRNSGYIEVRPSLPEPAYAVYGISKGVNRYAVIFVRSSTTPKRPQSIVRCRL